MKKTILALLMTGGSCAVFAQTDTSMMRRDTMQMQTQSNTDMQMQTTTQDSSMQMQNGTLSSAGNYNAYNSFTATVPDYMQTYVMRDYPTASDIRWRQTGDWWHGYSVANGQPTHMYYNNSGQTFTVSLPVRQGLVPETFMSRAVEMFGPTLYDVSVIKGTHGQEVYHIRTIENGQLGHHWLDESGNKTLDIYREDSTVMTNGTSMGTDANGTQMQQQSNGMNNTGNTNGTQGAGMNTDMNTTNGTNNMNTRPGTTNSQNSNMNQQSGKTKTKDQ
ncbi:MAG TPA: hypothetical protein VFR58_07040 [Flavisolibacter sp.]|nr:hypothetical protein [Flavisolibacter sp.]